MREIYAFLQLFRLATNRSVGLDTSPAADLYKLAIFYHKGGVEGSLY